jgi:hypothetical protein
MEVIVDSTKGVPVECPHFDIGCTFRGLESDVREHIKSCPYGMKEYIKEFLRQKEASLAAEQQLQQTEEDRELIRQALQAQVINSV